MRIKGIVFSTGRSGFPRDLGLLTARVGLAVTMLLNHGWGKLQRYGESAGQFPDPLGVGSETSMALTIFTEVLCSVLLALGLMGRLAALPLAFTMGVAFFVHHAADPFGRKELAFVYLLAFTGLVLAGPGRFSFDGLLNRK